VSAMSRRQGTGIRTHPIGPGHRLPSNRSNANWWLIAGALAACELAGIAAIVKSYEIAQTTLTSNSQFVWFWLGMIVSLLPIASLVARRSTSGAARSALLILFGLVSFAPKLLRNPTSPDYHDEFAHWRVTYNILSTGKLFQPAEIIPIISRYPGLHAATAALVRFTALDIWQAGTVLIAVLHLSLLLGIVALARSVGLDSRAASLAGIMYATNSSFIYFDTEFAYESMAITLLVWALVAFVQAIRGRHGQERGAWCCVTLLLCAGTVVTHHLSSISLTLIMALISIALSIPWLARREGWVRTACVAWSLTLVMGGMMLAWIHFVAPEVVSYLSPYLGSGLSELMQIASGSSSGRQLFGTSLSPTWESDAGLLLVPITFCLAVVALISMRGWIKEKILPNGRRSQQLPRGRRRSVFLAMTALGLVYFPSTLLILSAAGAEGARRSWADTWIGLAIGIGPVLVWLLTWVDNRVNLLPRIAGRTALSVLMTIALVGGTANGLDPTYRFPGPFLYGSDTRSDTPELDAMSQWFLNCFGPENHIVTDRYTGLVMASSGQQDTANPGQGFPVYDLYSDKPDAPIGPNYLLYELSSSHYLYLVVDEKMANNIPHVGVYFEPDEPVNFILRDGKSIFAGRLNKFNTTSWLYKVYGSDVYSVYRMALPPANVSYESHDVKFHGKLSVGQ